MFPGVLEKLYEFLLRFFMDGSIRKAGFGIGPSFVYACFKLN